MYLIQVSICWILFFALYYVAFKRLTFFNHNRWYLLASLTLGLVLPILAPYITVYKPDAFTTYINSDVLSSFVIVQNDTTDLGYYSYNEIAVMILWAVYLSGVMFLLMRMWYGLQQIYLMYHRGQKQKKNGIELVQLDSDMLPFSFFNRVFFGRKFNEKELESVMKHELVHINQHHTYDILFVEVLKCFFWFNPIVTFYKRSLKQAHEYIADHFTTHGTLDREYIHLLLNTSISSLQQELTNQFFNTEIKNRIDMMIRNKSAKSKLLNYILVLPTLLVVGYAFASNAVTYVEENNILSNQKNILLPEEDNLYTLNSTLQNDDIRDVNIEEAFNILNSDHESIDKAFWFAKDKTPARFYTKSEANAKLSIEEKSKLALDELLKFIYTRVKYPAEARKNNITGLLIVEFKIDTDGKMKNLKLAKSIHPSLDASFMEVVKSLSELQNPWIPAMSNGKAVESKISLPIIFKIQGSELPINKELIQYIESSIIDSEIAKYGKESYLKTPIIVVGYGENKEILFDGEENYQILKDGKKINPSDLKDLDKKDIKNLEVSPRSNNSKGVIKITSKELKTVKEEKVEKFTFEPNINSNIKKDTTRWSDVYITVDGVFIEGTSIKDIDPNELESISVFKGKSLIEKNVPKQYTGLVEVTTKTGAKFKNSKIIKDVQKPITYIDTVVTVPVDDKVIVVKRQEMIHYILDDKESSSEAVGKLNPDDIKDVQVFKGNLDSFKLGRDFDGVIKVTTKNVKSTNLKKSGIEKEPPYKIDLLATFYPNPSYENGTLEIKTNDTKTPITVKGYNDLGKEIMNLVIKDHNGYYKEKLGKISDALGASTISITQGSAKTAMRVID